MFARHHEHAIPARIKELEAQLEKAQLRAKELEAQLEKAKLRAKFAEAWMPLRQEAVHLSRLRPSALCLTVRSEVLALIGHSTIPITLRKDTRNGLQITRINARRRCSAPMCNALAVLLCHE